MRKLFLLLALTVVTLSASAQNTCFADFIFTINGNTVAFQDKSKPDTLNIITSRNWTSSNGQTAAGPAVTFTFPNPGSYNICLNIKTSSNCVDTVCKMVNIFPPPKLCRAKFDFMVDNMTKTVQFYNQSESDSGLIDGVLWRFGDAKNSIDWNAVHTYNFYGDYPVKLIINVPSNGCKDSITQMVKIHADSLCKPYFGFMSVDTSYMSFNFIDSSMGNPSQWYWDFGDGTNFFTGKVPPTHTFPQPGFYNVCLQVYDSVSQCQKTFCKIVRAGNTGCKAFFRAGVDPMNMKIVKFNNESIGNFTKLIWNFGDGANSSDNTIPVYHEYPGPGFYNACLTIFDSLTQCWNEHCQTIQIGLSGCFANFEAKPDSNNMLAFQFMNNSMGSVSKAFWEFGDGTVTNTFHTFHEYMNPGNYEVCLSVFDSANACQNRICRFIKVGNVACIADFLFFVDSSSNTVSFQNQSSSANGNPMGKFWKFGDGNFFKGANPSHTYDAPGFYEVCLTVFDSANNCQNTKCLTVKVGGNTNFACLAKYTFFPDPASLKINFSADPSSGNLTHFYWDFGNGDHSIDKNTSYTFSSPGYYKVCLIVMDSITNCHNMVCNMIQVGTSNSTLCLAKYSFFPDTTTKSIRFNDESLGNITHRFWEFGDGTSSTEMAPNHQYTSPGIYKVCLSVYDSTNNCQNTVCNPLELGQGHCWIDFMFTISTANNLTVNFQGNVQGNITKGLWEFGDGSTVANKLNPVHTYANPGFYDVCVSVFDSVTNCHKRICKGVKVGGFGCRSEFTYFIDSLTRNVIFKAMALGTISNHHWDFGDGSSSDSANTSHKYSQPGFYRVCLSTHDPVSNCGDVFCLPIQIGSGGCEASYEYFIDPATKTVAFESKSLMGTNSTVNYFWDFGDGTSSMGPKPTHTYLTPGIYKVCLAVKNITTGCHDLTCQLIQLGTPNCKANYNFFNDASTKTVSFYDKSIGDSTMNRFWDFGDGEHSKKRNPIHTYLSSGLYNVCLSVWDSIRNCVDNHCAPIRVAGANCQSSFSYFVDSTNNMVNFSDMSLGNPTKWFWEFGDGTVSNQQNPTHTYSRGGYFKVCLAIFNAQTGCHNFYCQVVMISGQSNDCEANFEYFADPVTRKVTFTDLTMGNPTHRFWQMGDGIGFSTDANPTYSYSKPGFYDVCLTIYNSQTRCHDTYCQVINLSDPNHCKARFERYVDSTQTAFFEDRSFGKPDKWYWTFGDGDTSFTQNPSHIYSQAGLYKVCLRIRNSQTNCVDHRTRLVKIKNQNGLYAGFSHVIDSTYSCKNCAATYPVKFNGESWGDPAKWAWDFGDNSGNYSIDTVYMNPTHEYLNKGSYKVCLTVSDPELGLSDTQCDTVTVGTTEVNEIAIKNVSMLRNYPNPFNESTVVYYSLATSGTVKMEIFDLMGKNITQLVNENKQAGKYVIEWNSGKLQSGVYFIKLTTANETLIQKMSIVK